MAQRGKKNGSAEITISGPAGGQSRSRTARDLIEKSVDAQVVKESYERFLEALKGIVDVPAPKTGSFKLEEVEFTAEVTANGEFKLMGTGVGLEGKGGVKFTLRRG
jgi:hypothetical protein